MLALIQLVSHAAVDIDGQSVARIERGILALIGIEKSDQEAQAEQLLHKVTHYRIFPDEQGKMNRSLLDVAGGLLLVPQFTLVADTAKGTRPGFSIGMPPVEGKRLFDYLVAYARKKQLAVAAGVFGASMQVSLCNDGPVTFMLKA